MVRGNSVQETGRGRKFTLAESFRQFSRAMEDFTDFEQFRVSLARTLDQEPHFSKMLLSSGDSAAEDSIKKAEATFKMGNVVIPLRDDAEGSFIRVAGRRDSRPFSAEDLHLMGAIATFVSCLYGQSKKHGRNLLKMRMLQFLIDQLPVGVVCLGPDNKLLARNTKAWQQLALSESADHQNEASVFSHLQKLTNKTNEVHLEVEGRLLFALKREFEDNSAGTVSAYVLYDMDQRRKKLTDSLDREYYRALCNESRVTVCLLEETSMPGAIFAAAKRYSGAWQVAEELIQPLDAYTAACLFVGATQISVRELLRKFVVEEKYEGLRVSIVGAHGEGGGAPSKMTLDHAKEQLRPYSEALLPELLIFDPYEPVVETLEVTLEKVCRLYALPDFEEIIPHLRTFLYNGLIVDLDSIKPEQLKALKQELSAYSNIQAFYVATKQRSMIEAVGWPLQKHDILIQKPFNGEEVINVVRKQLNLA